VERMARTLESTDAKIVAMIRGLSGPLAYDLIATYDIDEPTQLDDDSLSTCRRISGRRHRGQHYRGRMGS
jgi:hypothetical protein